MSIDRDEQILVELGRVRLQHADPELAALTVALLLEDALDVVLTDDDVDDPTLLDDPRKVLHRRGGS